MIEHLLTLLSHRFTHTIESKDLLHNLVPYLRVRLIFCVQNVLLKKRVFPVHMRAIKQSVSINDFLPKTLTDIRSVVIGLTLDVVLVTSDILSFVHFSLVNISTLCNDRLLIAP
jgi:hypothetical protein